MTQVLDQSADKSHKQFHQYAKLYGLPEFVKSASVDETGLFDHLSEPQSLPASCYADIREPYQFPIHTKAAAYLSWVYYLNNDDQIDTKSAAFIRARLDKAAAYWEIRNEVDRLQAKHTEVNKVGSEILPDSDYALVYVESDGTKVRELPIRNTVEVKVAAEWFINHRDHYDFANRQSIAKKIITQAEKLGADLGVVDDAMQKQAGFGFCTPKQAAELVRTRMYSANVTTEVREKLAALSRGVERGSAGTMDHDTLSNLALTVDTIDRAYGVKYSEAHPRPEDTLFQVTYKEAEDLESQLCNTVSGKVYDRRDFAKISLNEVRDRFGDDLAKAVSTGMRLDSEKLADIVATMPRDDASLFENLALECGVHPVGKVAAEQYSAYNSDILERFAAFYGTDK